MEILNWKSLDKGDIYCCFSFPLHEFIVSHGLEPIAQETHKKTGKQFSVFIKGEKLQALLTEWTANKPTDSNKVVEKKRSYWKNKESGEE